MTNLVFWAMKELVLLWIYIDIDKTFHKSRKLLMNPFSNYVSQYLYYRDIWLVA